MDMVMAALVVGIRLVDGIGLPAADVAAAVSTATRVLDSASVQAQWTHCSLSSSEPACDTALKPAEVIVRIQYSPPELADGILGDALVVTTTHSGVLASVFFDRVSNLALRSGTSAPEVLGRVMAHEVAHLLLGTTRHSRRGLMRAVWTDSELRRDRPSDWVLSRAEAARLRNNVARQAPRSRVSD